MVTVVEYLSAAVKGKPIDDVLTNFFHKDNGVRYRARLELSGRESDDVMRGVGQFVAQLDPANDDPSRDESQALLECLWVHEEHRVPNLELIKKTFDRINQGVDSQLKEEMTSGSRQLAQSQQMSRSLDIKS